MDAGKVTESAARVSLQGGRTGRKRESMRVVVRQPSGALVPREASKVHELTGIHVGKDRRRFGGPSPPSLQGSRIIPHISLFAFVSLCTL